MTSWMHMLSHAHTLAPQMHVPHAVLCLYSFVHISKWTTAGGWRCKWWPPWVVFVKYKTVLLADGIKHITSTNKCRVGQGQGCVHHSYRMPLCKPQNGGCNWHALTVFVPKIISIFSSCNFLHCRSSAFFQIVYTNTSLAKFVTMETCYNISVHNKLWYCCCISCTHWGTLSMYVTTVASLKARDAMNQSAADVWNTSPLSSLATLTSFICMQPFKWTD